MRILSHIIYIIHKLIICIILINLIISKMVNKNYKKSNQFKIYKENNKLPIYIKKIKIQKKI